MKKKTVLFGLCLSTFFTVLGQVNGQGNGQGNGNGNSNNPNQNALRWDRQGNSVDTSEFIGTINQQPLKVKTGNQERMRITPDGKVGIGIWNPLEKFDVLGTIRSREDIKVDGSIFVNGTSNFYGEALFSNSVRMPGLQTASPSLTDDIIVRGEDGVLKNLTLGHLVDIIYFPRICLEEVTPHWQSTHVPAEGDALGYGKLVAACASRVGIGTNDPLYSLDVRGIGRFSNRLLIGESETIRADFQISHTSTNPNARLLLIENNNEVLLQLASNGMLRAREIKVDVQAWPDYVFAKNYPLMPLEAVENFIKENGHLPNVPNAQQMEEDGINLAETNKLLMEKVEELTLYLIEQNKAIEQMKKQIDELQKP